MTKWMMSPPSGQSNPLVEAVNIVNELKSTLGDEKYVKIVTKLTDFNYAKVLIHIDLSMRLQWLLSLI